LPFLLVIKADKVRGEPPVAAVRCLMPGAQVCNVRLRVAAVFALLLRMGEPWCSLSGVQSTVAELKADGTAEVRLRIC
jgi:hypothetical protein